MRKYKTREIPAQTIINLQSSPELRERYGYSPTNNSKKKPEPKEEPPLEISVLLVGLDSLAQKVVRAEMPYARIDSMPLSGRIDIRDRIWAEADRKKNSKHGYDLVIVDAEGVDPILLNAHVRSTGGRTVFYNSVPACAHAVFAKDAKALEQILEDPSA